MNKHPNVTFRIGYNEHISTTLHYAKANEWEASYRRYQLNIELEKAEDLLKRSKLPATVARNQAKVDVLQGQLRVAHQDYAFWNRIRRDCEAVFDLV